MKMESATRRITVAESLTQEYSDKVVHDAVEAQIDYSILEPFRELLGEEEYEAAKLWYFNRACELTKKYKLRLDRFISLLVREIIVRLRQQSAERTEKLLADYGAKKTEEYNRWVAQQILIIERSAEESLKLLNDYERKLEKIEQMRQDISDYGDKKFAPAVDAVGNVIGDGLSLTLVATERFADIVGFNIGRGIGWAMTYGVFYLGKGIFLALRGGARAAIAAAESSRQANRAAGRLGQSGGRTSPDSLPRPRTRN